MMTQTLVVSNLLHQATAVLHSKDEEFPLTPDQLRLLTYNNLSTTMAFHLVRVINFIIFTSRLCLIAITTFVNVGLFNLVRFLVVSYNT